MVKFVRMVLVVAGYLLVALGLLFLAYDRLSILHYNVGANNVAGFIDDFINGWLTGEQPDWALVAPQSYCLISWPLALAAFGLRRELGQTYVGRIWRGAEWGPKQGSETPLPFQYPNPSSS